MRRLAIGIAAALSLAATASVNAQGIWVGGPGVGVGVGFGPTYAYDAYPSDGYTSVAYRGGPAWGDAYAYEPVAAPVVADSYAYAPAVSVGYGYEPAYSRVTSSARYAYPERVTSRQSYAYSPRRSTQRVVYESGRRSGVSRDVVAGSRIEAGTERIGSRVSSERVSVRGGHAMARGSRQDVERASVTRDLR
jgi:hypothetical protein